MINEILFDEEESNYFYYHRERSSFRYGKRESG